ncbi:MAG: DUF523 and DUF1722 domain-containing protein [Methylomicrobium sp.]
MHKILLGITGSANELPAILGIAADVFDRFFEGVAFSSDEEKMLTTAQFRNDSANGADKTAELCGYIVTHSTSTAETKAIASRHHQHDGIGLKALKIMHHHPLLPVEETSRLSDVCLRDNFYRRVFVIHRWRSMLRQGLTAHSLIDFHARHKLIIMCHGDYRELGQLLASLSKENLPDIADRYITQLMSLLLTVPTRANHANVLQHIQGYLKKELDRDDKAELCELIEQYRTFAVPLIAPITLLKHHFRKLPDPYIASSYYFTPYPSVLATVIP